VPQEKGGLGRIKLPIEMGTLIRLGLVCGSWDGRGRRAVYDCKALIQEVPTTECLRSGIFIRFWRLVKIDIVMLHFLKNTFFTNFLHCLRYLCLGVSRAEP
jgi:hypothetical protein